MLVDRSVRDLLSAFSSSEPTPGGGSAAALASSVGASLLLMVARLPKSRTAADADRTALTESAAVLEELRSGLTAAIDADSAAYDQVVAAYKLPKATPEEQDGRKAAVQRAMRAATEVPLGVMQQSVRALEHAGVVAAHGYTSAASDVGVAIALLAAGARGAKLNVDANLGAITDSEYRDRLGADARGLLERAGRLSERAEALLR